MQWAQDRVTFIAVPRNAESSWQAHARRLQHVWKLIGERTPRIVIFTNAEDPNKAYHAGVQVRTEL
jgi:hypothetical protein